VRGRRLPAPRAPAVIAGLDFAIGLDPGVVQLSTLHVLPGTDLWCRAEELGVRYDPLPPHEVIATAQLDYVQLRRLEVLGTAATAVYKARVEQGRQQQVARPSASASSTEATPHLDPRSMEDFCD